MQITDSLALDASGLTFTRDGFLTGNARVSRAGNVQDYLGAELGLKGADAAKMFGVYRDPDVVFDEASMQSLAGRPVTRNHPPAGVEATTWKDLAVGHVGGRIVRDGEHVVASMAIMDAVAAQEVANGARSLSAGYTVSLIKDAGVAPDGTPFQYRQTGPLRFNHVAYLPDNNPRAGNTKIGDHADKWGAAPNPATEMKGSPMADNIRNVMVDGLTVTTTDQGAQAIDKLTKQVADKATELKLATDLHDTAIADKDAELATKDAKIAELEGAALTADALDAKVAERAALVDTAKRVAPKVDTKGLTDAALRKAAVVAVRGADAMAGKSDAYIDAAFDLLAEAKPADPLAPALGRMATTQNDGATKVDDAYQAMLADLGSAHKGGVK